MQLEHILKFCKLILVFMNIRL